jgi:hypothetical protein
MWMGTRHQAVAIDGFNIREPGWHAIEAWKIQHAQPNARKDDTTDFSATR